MYTADSKRYDSMLYRRCGASGIQLPAISLGLWHNFGGVDVFENGRAMLRRAFDMGVTHFDLANNYGPPPGSAEENIRPRSGLDFAPYRDELILSTKAGYEMWAGPYGSCGSRKYLLASLDQSLKRMRVDYVDIFYSHRFDPQTPMEETMGALDQAVRSGRALYAGISNYPPEQTAQAAAILSESRHALPDSSVQVFDVRANPGERIARRTPPRGHRRASPFRPWRKVCSRIAIWTAFPRMRAPENRTDF